MENLEILRRREVLQAVKKAVVINPSVAKYPDSLGKVSVAGEHHFNGFWHRLLNDAARDAKHRVSYVFDRGTELALDYQDGYKLQVVDELIRRYSGLVAVILKSSEITEQYGFDEEDAKQQAVFGIYKAAEKYDIKKGQKFDTFATWKIKGALTEASRESGRTIRLPASHTELVSKYNKHYKKLSFKLGREPATHEVADSIGVRSERMLYVLEDARITNPLPINSSLYDDVYCIPHDSAIVALQDLERTTMRRYLKKALSLLEEKERRLLEMRFGLWGNPELMVKDRAKVLGIKTSDTVRVYESRALEKVRDFILQSDLGPHHLLQMEGID